jgi:protein-tyrosine phosphatase
MEQPILENLWWVLPGKLAGVRKPTAEELVELQSAGIGAIVSLMDDPANLNLYEQAGIPHCWLPTTGGTAPTPEQLATFQEFVDHQTSLGRGVAVHCTSGRRRTGTILAAYLIHTGHPYADALDQIYQANPTVELREAQLTFLRAIR